VKFHKKALLVISICLILITISLGLISLYIVKRFTSRRVRDDDWHVKVTLYKQSLCKDHHGIPISFTTKDGIDLSGILFVREKARYNLLVCHGYFRHKEDVRRLVELCPDENVLFFDYRAHGESAGSATTIGAHEIWDVMAAYSLLETHEKTKELPIVGLGFSMGAATLLGAAAQGATFKGLIIDSVFKRLDEQIAKIFSDKTGLPAIPFARLCQTVYSYLYSQDMSDVNPYEWIQKIPTPMLIIHAKNDTFANSAIAHELFAVKPGVKKLWIVDDAPHATIFKHYPQEYAHEIKTFLSSLQDSSAVAS
jgi:pimeloyl-ACP methyl ester carboxylesterase